MIFKRVISLKNVNNNEIIKTTNSKGGEHYERICNEKIGEIGWVEKEKPYCGPNDALVKPLALSPCTSDVHTVWEGAIGEREDMILGHEGCGIVAEVGELVKDFKVGDRVMVAAITPDWNSLEAQAGFAMHSGGNASRLEIL